MLALVVEAAQPSGYRLTASFYGSGDRQPSEVEEYGPLAHQELEELAVALIYGRRPGWEYPLDGAWGQPPLWTGESS